MERYEAYKDSGVEWIGEIPEEWRIRRLKLLGTTRSGMGNKKPDDFGSGLPFLTYKDVYSRESFNTASGLVESTEDDRKRFSVIRGDAFFTGSSETIEELGFSSVCLETIPDATFNGFTIRFRPTGDVLYPEFAAYLFRSDVFRGYLRQRDNSITRSNLSQQVLGDALAVLPSAEEQQAIADYLDAKTAEIDSLVADCEREVELLREYRKAVISEAVTKGLDPDAPMKDSGIEWMGEVPEGWKIVQLGRLCETRNGLDYDATQVCSIDDDGATLVVRSGNILSGKLVLNDCVYIRKEVPEQLRLRKGDVVIVRTNGSRELVGKSAYVEEDGIGTLGAFMLLCRSRYGRYICWLFQSSMLTYYMGAFSTSTVNQLSNGTLRGLHVPCPPQGVQDGICDYLDAKTAEIDSLIEAKRQMADKLREYRKSLISEAVTGKFKVPGVK